METDSHHPIHETYRKQSTLKEALISTKVGLLCGNCRSHFPIPENITETTCPIEDCHTTWSYISVQNGVRNMAQHLDLYTRYESLTENPRYRQVVRVKVAEEFL